MLGASVVLAGRSCSIERRAGTAARPILRVDGVADRDAAEALRGEPLWVARAALPPLEEDEYWAHDLEGCAVVDGSRAVGVVRAMLPLPSCEVLEVVREDADPLLVPLIRDAVRSVDVEAKLIDIDLGFLGEA